MTANRMRFRVWDKDEQEMLTSAEGCCIAVQCDGVLLDAADAPIPPEDVIWMQSTGLIDKNGVEIFEGDVLKDDVRDLYEAVFGELPLDKSGDCVCTYEAFYAKGYGKLGSSPNYECTEIADWMEIVGNVHEHPALLGGP